MQSNQEQPPLKVSLPLEEVEARLEALRFPDVDMIVAIGSGGLHPARLIAEKLGLPIKTMQISYRKQNNQPRYDQPRLLHMDPLPRQNLRVLLVDDVSVSGKTIATARQFLTMHTVTTFVLKGNADYVLFPEITACVNWPWNGEK